LVSLPCSAAAADHRAAPSFPTRRSSDLGERDRAGEAFNDLVARGEISAPVVLGRDHLDCGSVASPYRETEGMADGSDAIADWPLDRKSTRLNSSHVKISYAVFCLKKKKK